MPSKVRAKYPKRKTSCVESVAGMRENCPVRSSFDGCEHEVVTRMPNPKFANCACGRTVTRSGDKWIAITAKDAYTGATAFQINPDNDPDYGNSFERISG